MKLLLKPHHFLDILKLYGSGLNSFAPDTKRGHDFWKVGNEVLKNPQVNIEITTKADDICKPCRFSKNNICQDKIENFAYCSKEEWNQIIDKRLLKILGLQEKDSLTAIEFCKLANQKLSEKVISKIWQERSLKETKQRIKYLLAGLKRYNLFC